MKRWAHNNAVALYFFGYAVFYFGFLGGYTLNFARVGEFTAGGGLGWAAGMAVFTWREFETFRRACLAASVVVVLLCFLGCWFSWIVHQEAYSDGLLLAGVACSFAAAWLTALLLRGRCDKPWGVARA